MNKSLEILKEMLKQEKNNYKFWKTPSKKFNGVDIIVKSFILTEIKYKIKALRDAIKCLEKAK